MRPTILVGLDSDQYTRPALFDSSGRVIVNMAVGALTQPLPVGDNNIGNVDVVTLPVVTVQPQHGGFWPAPSDRYAETIIDSNIGGGYDTVNLTAVPEGFFYRITGAIIRYTGTVTGVVLAINGILGGNTYRLLTETPVLTQRYYFVTCEILAKEGDYMQGVAAAGTAGDDLEFGAWGAIYPIA